MLGHSHALSGACAGVAAGIVLHLGVADVAALGLGTAGAALIPDLDSCGSCSARSLGLISVVPSLIIRKLSGGHRHATHSILGIGVFGVLAWLACTFRHDLAGKIGLGFLVTLIVAGGLEALRICRNHTADLIGAAVSAGVVFYGFGLTLIPVAIIAGCAAHIAGDMLTSSGCPLLTPVSKYRFKWWPRPLAFTTGTMPERLLVDPVLILLLAALAYVDIARIHAL
jgi:membrane-bound metal-dependent hydrolase YbcI (DUF457 family)